MTLRIPAKVLIHVWSYDFYDMTTVYIRAYAEQTVTERTDVYRSTCFFAPKMFCTVFHPKLYASNVCYIGLACPSTIFQNTIISGMEAL